MIARFLQFLLAKFVSFGPKKETVVDQAYWNVSPKNAFQICKNYEEFLKVMLPDQKDSMKLRWKKGGPGEVGAQVEYLLKRQDSESTIVEEIVQISEDDGAGIYTLEWKMISSSPQLPLKDYGCTWVIEKAGDTVDCPCSRLVWTRHFQEPLVFGFFSLSSYLKQSFSLAAGPIMDWVFRPYYAEMFPPEDRRLPKKTDRVVVIGAGPSGLHMAHVLRNEVGIENITILERDDRHGGKSLSIQDTTAIDVPDNETRKIVHELGTCYLHPAYFAVRTLVKQLQTWPGIEPGEFGTEIGPKKYAIRRQGIGNSVDLDDWIIQSLQIEARPGIFGIIFASLMRLFRVFWPKAGFAELLVAKTTYNRLHAKYFGRYSFSMPPYSSEDHMKEIDMSFGEFLEQNELTALTPMLAYAQTAQGYGSIENTPAFWAMCWITPQLLDGYFLAEYQDSIKEAWLGRRWIAIRNRLIPGINELILPKKSMFREGWLSIWDKIIQVNNFQVRYKTDILNITRPDNSAEPIKVEINEDGNHKVEYFDYLVVAAPLTQPDPGGKEVALDLRTDREGLLPSEKELLQSIHTSHCQFRTNLIKVNQPQPYLEAHVTLDAERLVGPGAGMGDVFGARDSYLALNPKRSEDFELHQSDPMRGKLREQMCYQWVEFDKDIPSQYVDQKYDDWLTYSLGDPKNYDRLKSKTWTYFQHFNRVGLNGSAPWMLLELQGRNRTLFVHASNFFESVLDIVNYNNMIVEGLQGKLNTIGRPETDSKQQYYDSFYWRALYNRTTRTILSGVNFVIGIFWWLFFWITRIPFQLTVNRILRCWLQHAFRTANVGPWWKFDMNEFVTISPAVICFWDGKPDAVLTLAQEEMSRQHPEIPVVDRSLRLSYHDWRTLMRVWLKLLDPNFMRFMTPWMQEQVSRFRAWAPIFYNWAFTWGMAFGFNFLTGWCRRVEDKRGGGLYVPKCEFLIAAKAEYGEQLGSRICTHGCKIFIEESFRMRGLDVVLEPYHETSSCMIRALPFEWPAYADHAVDCKLSIQGHTDPRMPIIQ